MMKDLLELARANNLSGYNASYLDLAAKKGISSATLDNRLIAAARYVYVSILAF